MARPLHKLTAMQVNRAGKPGYYSDGGGLFLRVGPTGAKSWAFRFAERGRTHEMGLGPCHTITLAEARQKAQDARKLRLDGINPIEARRAQRARSAAVMTFAEAAEKYIAAHEAGWRSPRQAPQWRSTLRDYAFPVMGALPVAEVGQEHVMAAVEPIWPKIPVTANHVRNRIESVLDWAAARGYRSGDNPARWRGHLDKLLPRKSRVKPAEPHPALAYGDIGAFMAALRGRDTVAARALEFTILTASRTGEVIGATWQEIDLQNRVWTVPAARMKAGKEHRVPLSDRTVEILQRMAEIRENEYVFPGRSGRLSHDALRRELDRVGQGGVNVHGFRSTFRDWAAERTGYPEIVAELALAHTVGNAAERAYRRTDLFDRRRRMMEDWATFSATPAAAGGGIVALRSALPG